MNFKGKSWLMVLVAAGVGAAIYGLVVWTRGANDPTLVELMQRMPPKDALTIHVDLAAMRKAGLSGLLEGTPVAEEADYRSFVTESGFDWKTDLEAVTATRHKDEWYLFVRGRFDLERVRKFSLVRGGQCRNGVCEVAGATPGRLVSFFPVTPKVMAVATSKLTGAVYALRKRTGNSPPLVLPDGPVWVSLNGSVLAGDPALPSGGRLFGKVLSETERTTFWVTGNGATMELRMTAYCRDEEQAGQMRAQLEGVTTEFRKYFERVGQPTSTADLSGLLLAGDFTATGKEVAGRWPLHMEFLKKLLAGAL